MRSRRPGQLVLIWILLTLVLTQFMFAVGQAALDEAVLESVDNHLRLTLEESYFGNAQNRTNDQQALQHMARALNDALQNLIVDHWYSPQRHCAISLVQLDDVEVGEGPFGTAIRFQLIRNQIEREVVLGLSCSRNWLVGAGAGALLALLFSVIWLSLPPPLSKLHRQWINYLLERGYSGEDAFGIVRQYDNADALSLSAAQLSCVEQLHDSGQQNFSRVLALVTDDRVAALQATQIDWLLLGLRDDPNDLEKALALAQARADVTIDLVAMTLNIHGIDVSMSRTPLFYYAWYALHRLLDEGWITNPASNRPDRALGQELVDLMARFGGHGKAINDLERTGLKARTLDQNRSKIKDEIVAALGDKLAGNYLFETSKHADGIHTRYRLHIEPSRIAISPALL